MKKIQFSLMAFWIVLLFFTLRAFSEMDVLRAAITFYDDFRAGWRAQLNFDFQGYLILAALWIFYREKTFLRSFVFALLELLAGNLFFAPYLAYLISNTGGDMKKILLGSHSGGDKARCISSTRRRNENEVSHIG